MTVGWPGQDGGLPGTGRGLLGAQLVQRQQQDSFGALTLSFLELTP